MRIVTDIDAVVSYKWLPKLAIWGLAFENWLGELGLATQREAGSWIVGIWWTIGSIAFTDGAFEGQWSCRGVWRSRTCGRGLCIVSLEAPLVAEDLFVVVADPFEKFVVLLEVVGVIGAGFGPAFPGFFEVGAVVNGIAVVNAGIAIVAFHTCEVELFGWDVGAGW